MVNRIGVQIGNYRLTRLLGSGGFADVYLGEHAYLKTQAAVKVLQTRVTEYTLQAFIKEAQTIARLTHPHIVRVLDFGVEKDTPFLILTYAPHGTLRQRHPPGSQLSPVEVVNYVKQMAASLQYAHDRNIIHRDVKPENMLIGLQGEILLSDFGIALVSSHSHVSTQGIDGTVAYMAPEQIQGKAEPASDQYALGITVYEWLTGQLPFYGSLLEIGTQHLFKPIPPFLEQGVVVSPHLESVVQKALHKKPQQRFESIEAFASALEQASEESHLSLVSIPDNKKVQIDAAKTALVINPYGDDPALSGIPTFSHLLHQEAARTQQIAEASPDGARGKVSQFQVLPARLPAISAPLSLLSVKINKQHRKRRLLFIVLVIAFIAASISGVSFLLQSHSTIQTPLTPTPAKVANRVVPTKIASQIPTKATASPAPSPPTAGPTLLYQANGYSGWEGSKDWKVFKNRLLSDGTDYSIDPRPTIVSPYQVTTTTDYAVQAQIRIIRGLQCLDLALRGEVMDNGWHGYKAVVCLGQIKIQVNNTVLIQKAFKPDEAWHTYRLEARGNTFTFFMDGNLLLEAVDNTYLSGEQTGLKAFVTQLEVADFEVIALSN